MVKLKKISRCGDCQSCIELYGNGKFYCNMKISDPKRSEMDVSTCEVDLSSKPDDCPWDKADEFVASLNPEDQLGLKCIAKMFNGGDQNLFEEEEIQPTIGKWIETDKMLPRDRNWYLGIFQEMDTGWINPIPFICNYLLGSTTKATTKEGWIIRDCTDVDDPSDYYMNLHCVAWMPLPEPYSRDNWGEDIYHA